MPFTLNAVVRARALLCSLVNPVPSPRFSLALDVQDRGQGLMAMIHPVLKKSTGKPRAFGIEKSLGSPLLSGRLGSR